MNLFCFSFLPHLIADPTSLNPTPAYHHHHHHWSLSVVCFFVLYASLIDYINIGRAASTWNIYIGIFNLKSSSGLILDQYGSIIITKILRWSIPIEVVLSIPARESACMILALLRDNNNDWHKAFVPHSPNMLSRLSQPTSFQPVAERSHK